MNEVKIGVILSSFHLPLEESLQKIAQIGIKGEGDVPFKEYFKALKEIGYNGFLTIERETGNDRVADIAKEKKFLEKFLQEGTLR